MTPHWAGPLIGKPWKPGADGPDAFDCWGLVRHVFAIRHGIDMPAIKLGDFGEGENVAAIKNAATVSGWRPVYGDPKADDIVLMMGPDGRHVGVMVDSLRGLLLLHADGHMTIRGPVGSVVAVPLKDATQGCFGHIELWRRDE